MDLKESAQFVRDQFQLRNQTSKEFVPQHSDHLAQVCQRMAERFRKGGRLLAFGNGCWATDAQHVSVEFVHPVIVGKRALPALDLSASPTAFIDHVLRPHDMLMGFGPPQCDPQVRQLLRRASKKGALTIEWPGRVDGKEIPSPSDDPFIHQEIIEILYHTLWETVHVFLEHSAREDDVGASSFLYPFLTRAGGVELEDALADVSNSILRKADEDVSLRQAFARESAPELARAALAVRERLEAGGTIVAFGNGGSATDANDLALDCVDPPEGLKPVRGLSLAMEPANISAIANDVGIELVFLRQLIANGGPPDVAVGISTSGNSKNVCEALKEAKKRGMLTIGLVGYDGGDVLRQGLAEHTLVVHSDYIPRLQEIQASIYHVLRRLIS